MSRTEYPDRAPSVLRSAWSIATLLGGFAFSIGLLTMTEKASTHGWNNFWDIDRDDVRAEIEIDLIPRLAQEETEKHIARGEKDFAITIDTRTPAIHAQIEGRVDDIVSAHAFGKNLFLAGAPVLLLATAGAAAGYALRQRREPRPAPI